MYNPQMIHISITFASTPTDDISIIKSQMKHYELHYLIIQITKTIILIANVNMIEMCE